MYSVWSMCVPKKALPYSQTRPYCHVPPYSTHLLPPFTARPPANHNAHHCLLAPPWAWHHPPQRAAPPKLLFFLSRLIFHLLSRRSFSFPLSLSLFLSFLSPCLPIISFHPSPFFSTSFRSHPIDDLVHCLRAAALIVNGPRCQRLPHPSAFGRLRKRTQKKKKKT